MPNNQALEGAPVQIKKGDTVRVKAPEEFLTEFARKIKDRDAVVNWVGPDSLGQFKGKASVTFKKRGNRGKEFREMMNVRDLVLVKSSEATHAA